MEEWELSIGLGIGGVFIFGGGIWSMVIPFRESTSHGLLHIFVPFYSTYYLITRWSSAKKPFFVSLAGVVVMLATFIISLA